MAELTNINVIKDLMLSSGLKFSHALGQNFIINKNVILKMINACGISKETATFEIGTGIGSLTKELAKTSSKVVSVEIDKKLIPIINNNLKDYENITLINNDFLNLDLEALWEEHFKKEKEINICANLPYYVTSSIIMKILESKVNFKHLTVMVQKEVAKRISAPLGSREIGAISVVINYYCKPEFLFTVSKGNFIPIPKVDSAVIKLTKLSTPPVKVFSEDLFFKIIKLCFSKRRKTLVNSLSEFKGISKEKISNILNTLNLKNIRPENLTLEQFSIISNEISKLLN